MRRNRLVSWVTLALLVIGAPLMAQSGGIEGRVAKEDGTGIGGVTVVVSELGAVQITDDDGAFAFDGIADGSYTLTFNLGDNAGSKTVEVAGGITEVEELVDWNVSFADTITVFSASRRRERVVDAPAAVTIVAEEEIQREASTGQLAKVLEFTPGVEVTQSGIFDYNLNTRGFNSSLNRRVQTIVDGRSPSVPFLGSTEWAFLSNMQDMASVELVRGPSSALYGANAFNGVLNVVTTSPSDAQGGQVRLTAGELSTLRADFSWSTGLGGDWYLKLNGNYAEGDDFAQDRVTSTEYAGLPREVGARANEYENTNLSVRLDKDFENGSRFTLEGGQFDGEGGTTVTGIGRVSLGDLERPWARANFTTQHFNLLAYYNGRESPDQLARASGGRIFLDTENRVIEGQTNWDFNGGKIRLVAGASYKEEEIDTGNDQGIQTLVFAPVEHDFTAFFGQVDFAIGDNLKLVLAGRWDDSSLFDSQVSPKAALVWNVATNHTMRFSYNEAFQVANYSEFFLDAPTAINLGPGIPPITSVDLRAVELGVCAPFGLSCGFGSPIGVRALGNANLELEEIKGFEVGYSGIFGNKAFLTVDYYNNELENFITDLTANPFGSINPAFGPYTLPNGTPAPAALIGILRGALGPIYPFLSNNVDGTPILALASYTNAGSVDTQGIDLGLNVYLTPEWRFEFSYSWFDFDVTEGGPGGGDLLPNAPENKASIGLSYGGERWGGSFKFRWVDSFEWSAGAFQGPIPSYEVADLGGYYRISETIELGLNVSNAFDDEHYESFGGDILGRRALGSVTFRW